MARVACDMDGIKISPVEGADKGSTPFDPETLLLLSLARNRNHIIGRMTRRGQCSCSFLRLVQGHLASVVRVSGFPLHWLEVDHWHLRLDDAWSRLL